MAAEWKRRGFVKRRQRTRGRTANDRGRLEHFLQIAMSANERFETRNTVSNHFAWLRTRMALDQVLMAWLRTSVSLIGFGFTITQFFQRLQDIDGRIARPMAEDVPRNLGLTLIAAGVGALVISVLQYRMGLRYLWSMPFRGIAGVSGRPMQTPVLLSALILIAIGVIAFGAVFFRMT